MQSGKYAAQQITERARRHEATDRPFNYFDKGSMATISRFSAVAQHRQDPVHRVHRLAGLALHPPVYLIGFKNRITTVLHWFVSFIGRGRSERVATIQQVFARDGDAPPGGGRGTHGERGRRGAPDGNDDPADRLRASPGHPVVAAA